MQKLVEQQSLFRNQSPEQFAELAALFERRDFRFGDVIATRGDAASAYFIIASGRVRVVRQFGDDDEEPLAVLAAGSTFGELGLLHPASRAVTLRASGDVALWRLATEDFAAFAAANPALHAEMLERVAGCDIQFPDILLDGPGSSDWRPTPDPRDPGVAGHGAAVIPSIRQIDEMDCGATALAMVCAGYGLAVGRTRIRDLVRSRDGSTLSDLTHAAGKLGLQAAAVKLSSHNFDRLSTPAIAHFADNHWIVVSRRRGERICIVDPATGPGSLTRDSFLERWTGHAIVFGAPFSGHEAARPRRDWSWLWPVFTPLWWSLSKIVLLTLFICGLQLLTPYLTMVVVDDVLAIRDVKLLNTIVLALGTTIALTLLLTLFQRRILSVIAVNLDESLIDFIMGRLLALPPMYFHRHRPGDIQRRLETVRGLRDFVVQSGVGGVVALVQVIAFLALMAWLSPPMTLIFLVMAPIYFGLMFFAGKLLRPAFHELQEDEHQLRALEEDVVNGIDTVKAAAAEPHFHRRLLSDFRRISQRQSENNFNVYCFEGTIQALGFLTTVLFLWIGTRLVMGDSLSLGAFVAFQMLVALSYPPILMIIKFWEDLQQSGARVQRLGDIIETAPEPTSSAGDATRRTVDALQGAVELRHVSVSYGTPDAPLILRNVNLAATPGCLVAVIGRSGSGKTTLARCLGGLLTPGEGAVLYDGVPATDYDMTSLRRQLGVVFQENHMFVGTVLQNIAFGDPAPDPARAMRAAEVASCHNLVSQLPDGLDTAIGAGGYVLSSGQKQCIAIARAVYQEPSVFIFDEATGAMDIESERLIHNNLGRILDGRTAFIITHRLATVRDADLIMVLDQGRIIESGTHAELMERRGLYYDLTQMQGR
ncbi:MAG: peptidase domain-containing ABC transporter [Lentisphaeria bacterium]|nr:peptidase domain-containing ABC transporter [Lentisphaeria bacterium]